jgi:hypothetical protein
LNARDTKYYVADWWGIIMLIDNATDTITY